MSGKIEFQTIIFEDGGQYDSYLKQTDVWSGYCFSRALGVLRLRNKAEVLIDKSY